MDGRARTRACRMRAGDGAWVLQESPPIIMINSFNEWHDGTEIEPSTEEGERWVKARVLGVRGFRLEGGFEESRQKRVAGGRVMPHCVCLSSRVSSDRPGGV